MFTTCIVYSCVDRCLVIWINLWLTALLQLNGRPVVSHTENVVTKTLSFEISSRSYGQI